ncbi:MAG: chemotaxis protein CheW [Lachnospiraceae bacterium]|nr:chemotaxis protein CheW [Lachnospiraceae bacterium]
MERAVFFDVANQTYGIDVEDTQAIEKKVSILPIPNTVPYIVGLIKLRGEIIPVYSLRKKFGMPPKASSSGDEQYIIANLDQNMHLALEVDGIREIVEINTGDTSVPPALIKTDGTGYISQVASVKNQLAVMISVQGLLSEEEKNNLKEFLREKAKESDNQEN